MNLSEVMKDLITVAERYSDQLVELSAADKIAQANLPDDKEHDCIMFTLKFAVFTD